MFITVFKRARHWTLSWASRIQFAPWIPFSLKVHLNVILPPMHRSMLGGSLVTTAWRVLRLRMEEKASRYGGQVRINLISRSGQPTTDGPPAWGLDVGLTIPHRKKGIYYEMFQSATDLFWFFEVSGWEYTGIYTQCIFVNETVVLINEF
jgi:hypothetical protein